MAQLPYELMDMIRNGGQPALAGGQQLPYALLDPIQNGGMPVLYQPKPSRIIPGMVSPFAPIAEPQAGDIPDQRARAQRYMRGQETPMASNATDFPVQQGALYRPGDETLSTTPGGVDSPAQNYADNLYNQGKNYPTGVPMPWNMPNSGQGVVSDSQPGVTLTAGQPDTTPVDMPRQMPASPSVGIPQPPVAFNTPQESGVAGNNYTSGSQTTNPQQPQGALAQGQQQPESNAMMMGLLAAGLGILANNTGNYGQAGPAIGKGGMMGVQTYLAQKKQEQEMAMAQQHMAMQNQELQGKLGNWKSEDQKRQADIQKAKQEMDDKMAMAQAYGDIIKRHQQTNPSADLSAIMSDPNTHKEVAAMMGITKRPDLAEKAMKTAMDLEKQKQEGKQIQMIPDGNGNEYPAVVDKGTGKVTKIEGAGTRPVFNDKPLVQFSVDTGPKAFWTKYGDIAAQTLGKQQEMAQSASVGITQLHEARRILDQGIISGSGADFKLGVGKALKSIGFDNGGDAASNTEAFAASMGRQVGELVKMFGAGVSISNADRDFAEKMAGGKINLEEKSIRRIMDISERAYRSAIDRYNTSITEVQNHPMAANLPKASMTVTSPPAYSGPQTQQTPQQQPNNKHFLYDPKTRKFIEQ